VISAVGMNSSIAFGGRGPDAKRSDDVLHAPWLKLKSG
jgi:hypothetical protein